jgi:hypothetical protein
VPIPELIALDLNRPVTFEMLGGDDGPDQRHLLRRAGNEAGDREAEDGRFLSGGHLRWSPENICCLHTPYYHGALPQLGMMPITTL